MICAAIALAARDGGRLALRRQGLCVVKAESTARSSAVPCSSRRESAPAPGGRRRWVAITSSESDRILRSRSPGCQETTTAAFTNSGGTE